MVHIKCVHRLCSSCVSEYQKAKENPSTQWTVFSRMLRWADAQYCVIAFDYFENFHFWFEELRSTIFSESQSQSVDSSINEIRASFKMLKKLPANFYTIDVFSWVGTDFTNEWILSFWRIKEIRTYKNFIKLFPIPNTV